LEASLPECTKNRAKFRIKVFEKGNFRGMSSLKTNKLTDQSDVELFKNESEREPIPSHTTTETSIEECFESIVGGFDSEACDCMYHRDARSSNHTHTHINYESSV
jgi:hypothetical protein